MPVTPTVSVWPQNISVRPAPRPSSTPTTFGRPCVTVSIDTSSPPRRISAAISVGDLALARRAAHQRRVHRVDGDELAQQLDRGIHIS